MKRRVKISLLITFFLAATLTDGFCQLESSFLYEYQMLQLINNARSNPLKAAAEAGVDVMKFLNECPNCMEIFVDQLDPLIFNDKLYATAIEHTDDMIFNNYYSSSSMSGDTFDTRIRKKIHDAVATGEALGLLAFTNYVEPAEAVRLIFKNMLKKEFKVKHPDDLTIFARDLEEAGISVGSGTMHIGGISFNVYTVTCDFASSPTSVLELEFLELVNQAREKPLAVAKALGADPDQVLVDNSEIVSMLTDGLPPLTSSRYLFSSSNDHASDLIEKGYFSEISIDGRTVEDRIIENGYYPVVSGEVLRLYVTNDYLDPEEGALKHFEKIFTKELEKGCRERVILNPEVKETGISLMFEEPGRDDSVSDKYSKYYLNMMLIDFAASSTPQFPFIKGRIYSDDNGDGLYGHDEGLAGIPVLIQNFSGEKFIKVFTNFAGGFEAQVIPGKYRVIALSGNKTDDVWTAVSEQMVDVGLDNVAVEFSGDNTLFSNTLSFEK